MSSIDNRVVQMEFDNRRFERGISTSMKSLGLFQTALSKIGGSAESFEKVEKTANGVDFSVLLNAADAVTRRFSTIGIVGDQIIRDLTVKVEQFAGVVARYVKMLSLDQISAGFDKYARKTEAVQTILNATRDEGKTIEDVNAVLDKLNKYTDETSYDFVTMTNSIGKFTSAGIELETAETAMEGIANWAAKAGVGPERAASAFYNMSQAIGTGAMKLQDWKSIENLNMATKDVKEQFIQAGVAAGTLVKKTKNVNGQTVEYYETHVAGHKAIQVSVEDFNSSLAQGWLTKDVLIDTMEKYADTTTAFGLQAYKAAQEAKTFNDAIEATKDAVSTGWLKTFELIFGNYEEAKVLWTDLANNLWEVFAAPAEARNELLEEWHVGGGYEAMVESLNNLWSGFLALLNSARDIISEIFPAPSAEKLISITEKFRDFTARFQELADFIADFNMFKEMVENGDAVMAAKAYEDQIDRFSRFEKIIAKVKDILQGFKSVLGIIGNLFSAIARSLKPIVEKYLGPLGSGIFDAASSFGKWVTNLEKTIKTNDTFYNAIQKVIGVIQRIIGFFKDLIGIADNTKISIGDLFDRFKKIRIVESFLNSVANFKAQLQSGKSFGDILKDAGNGIVSYFGTAIQNIGNKIKEVWPNILNSFKNLDFSKAFDLVGAGVAGGLGIKIFQFLKSFKLDSITNKLDFSFLTDLFDGITGSLESLQNKLNSETIKNIAISVAILAGSLILLAAVPPEDTMRGVTAIAALMGELIGAVKILSSGSLKNIGKIGVVAKALIKLSAAVVLLSIATTILSKLSWEELGRGLLGLVVILGTLIGVSYALNANAKSMKKAAKAMIPLSFAVILLAAAVKLMGSIDPDSFKQGLIGVIAVIGAMSLFALSTSISKFNLGTGAALIGLSIAVLILYKAVSKFGEMDSGQLKQGVIAMGIILLITSLIMVIAGQADHIFGSAAAFIVVGLAMQIIAKAVESLGNLGLKSLVKGLAGMVVAIGLVTTALLLLENGDVSLKGAAAMIVVAVALGIFAGAIKLLSTIPFEMLMVSFATLVGVIIAIGVASTLLSTAIPAMLGLAGAITLIGASVFLAGAGLMLFALALTSLAASGAAAALAFVAALGIFLEGLVNLTTSLTRAITALGIAVCDAIIALTPKLMQTLGVLLTAVGVLILNYVPVIGEILVRAIIMILQFLGTWVGPIVVQLITFLGQIIVALADGIRASGDILFPAIKNLVSAIIEFVISAIQMIVELIPGLGKKISEGLEVAKDSVRGFLTEDTGEKGVNDLAGGMENAIPEVEAASEGVTSAIQTPMADAQNLASEAGIKTGENFGDGLTTTLQQYDYSGAFDMESLPGGFGDMFKALNINNDAIAAGGSQSADSYLDAILASKEKAGATGQELADAVIAGTKLSEETFVTSGTEMASAFSDAIIEDLSTAKVNGAELGAAGVFGVQTQQPFMRQQGVNFVMGFATGMNSLRNTLYQVAYQIGYLALTAAKAAINSASPSKAMMEVGNWFDEGFIIGMESMSDDVYAAGGSIGLAALSSVESMLGVIEEKMNAETIYEPTIRPVLDLTNVTDGAGKINQLLSADPAIATRAIGYASQTRNDMQKLMAMNEKLQQNQNGSPTTVNLNVTTQELSNSTVDYLVRRVNKVLGGKV